MTCQFPTWLLPYFVQFQLWQLHLWRFTCTFTFSFLACDTGCQYRSSDVHSLRSAFISPYRCTWTKTNLLISQWRDVAVTVPLTAHAALISGVTRVFGARGQKQWSAPPRKSPREFYANSPFLVKYTTVVVLSRQLGLPCNPVIFL